MPNKSSQAQEYFEALKSEILEDSVRLKTLLTEAQRAEALLAGGNATHLQPASSALIGLRESKISLGDPRAYLRKVKREGDWNFFALSIPVSLQPARSCKFTLLEVAIEISASSHAVIHSMFPSPRWKKLFSLGYDLSAAVTIDGELEWGVEGPPALSQLLFDVLGPTEGRLSASGSGSVQVVVPNLGLKIGRLEITATGVGDTHCFWRLESEALNPYDHFSTAVVLKVPATVNAIELKCLAAAVPAFDWLAASLSQVMNELSVRLRLWLSQKRRAPLIGLEEHWPHIVLPTNESDCA